MRGSARLATVVLAGALAAGLGASARADESYPSRVVKVIVAFPPGSTLDALTRIITDQMIGDCVTPTGASRIRRTEQG
jgi:tripartite-type tricarboxylate transporter receptor subunit TctC